MNTTNEIKMEFIYKQSFTEPEQSIYHLYLTTEDFENLVTNKICGRIELILVSNQSNEYRMAVRNSEKARECGKDLIPYKSTHRGIIRRI